MKWFKKLGVLIVIITLGIGFYYVFKFFNLQNQTHLINPEDIEWITPSIVSPNPSNNNPTLDPAMLAQEAQDEAMLANLPVKPIPKGDERVPILLYHKIETLPTSGETSYFVSPATFERQMRWLAENNYRVISLDALIKYLKTGKGKPDDKSVVITFDDNTIGQYQNAYPILKKYHYNATFYAVPTWLDKGDMGKGSEYMSWANLKEMSDYGMEIGSHNYTHMDMQIASDDDLVFQTSESKKILEQKLGKTISAYAFPGGSYNDRAIAAVEKAGYVDATTVEKNIDHNAAELFHLGRMHIDDDLPYFKARIQGKFFK